ncbi:hypothetical protein QFC21_001744 [Naganishia friedmannii]|uniref:Uncharacterized protein n=1 Tax=Naganishia friedmannii TaxID=89922 RepID=A0ACC2W2P0_9TREE|nr:hypothetical protein QFC21_001744 [Naganishia friedmannii]
MYDPINARSTISASSTPRSKLTLTPINASSFPELQRVAAVQIESFDPFPEFTDIVEPSTAERPRLPFQDRVDSLARRLEYKLKAAGSHVGYKAENADGEVVGIAYWMKPGERFRIYEPSSMSEAERARYAGYDMEKYSALYRAFQDKIDEVTKSRSTWYLEILAVHPDHQKQSIGSQLLDLHLSSMQPDQLAWLESSPAGKRLYVSRGFEDVGDVVAEGWAEGFPAMRRNPEGSV